MAGQSGAADRRHQSRQVFLRGGRRGERPVVYSRGFSSIYGEWETTGEAKDDRTGRFPSRCGFPAPDKPVRVLVQKRDARNVFRDIWTTTIDPADKFVMRNAEADAGPLIKLHQSGDPARKARPADSRRRLHRARARQVRARREAADRDAARDVAVQGAAAATSTSGGCARRRRSPASRGRRSTSTGGRRSARPTTRSTPSATCSRSRTRRSATSPRTRRTTSSRS